MATYTGNTVEEAIERGLKREKIARENAHIEIEQRESKGFLGVGRKRARVTIEPIEEETVRRADRIATRHVDQSDMEVEHAESAMEATLRLNKVVKAVREAGLHMNENLTEEEKQEKIEKIKEKVQSAPVSEDDSISEKEDTDERAVLEAVSVYLHRITQEMGIETTVTYEKINNHVTQFELHSKYDALLIGKHGKILAGLEVLAKALANVKSKERLSICVNVGDYHEKRERYLVSLANRAAERALDGETVYINELPAQERKIIHRQISTIEGVSSHSEGKESKRYIVILPEAKNNGDSNN